MKFYILILLLSVSVLTNIYLFRDPFDASLSLDNCRTHNTYLMRELDDSLGFIKHDWIQKNQSELYEYARSENIDIKTEDKHLVVGSVAFQIHENIIVDVSLYSKL